MGDHPDMGITDLRAMASAMKEMYDEFRAVGFDRYEATLMTANFMAAMARNEPPDPPENLDGG